MRAVVPVACAVLLGAGAAACDDGNIELRDAGGGRPDPSFVVVDDGEGGGRAGGGGSGAPGGDATPPDTSGSPSGDGGGSEGSGGGGSSGGGGGGSPSPAVRVDDRGKVGTMGPALLRGAIGKATIEVDATPGEGLVDQASAALRSQLAEHGDKDVGFADGSVLPEQAVYTTEQLRALAETHRSVWSSSDRVALYVMVLSGRHEDEGVVGVSFGASSFAVFTERLGGGLLGLNYAAYEEAVVVHELGHLFGLVNLTGKGAFHEDPTHKGHSTNQTSVMYWAVESTVVGDVFEGGPPRDFDADDEQEMAAVRTG